MYNAYVINHLKRKNIHRMCIAETSTDPRSYEVVNADKQHIPSDICFSDQVVLFAVNIAAMKDIFCTLAAI